MPGVVFLNPDSGPDRTSAGDLVPHFDGAGAEIVECDPADLEDRLRKAAADRVDYVAVAGGDGTIRVAAEVLSQEAPDTPLLPIPAGTRNHFARELGIEDLETAGEVARHGVRLRIDLGEVNGRRFVNNSSVGIYPRIVVTRESHERRWPKGVATVAAAWEQLRHGRRYGVTFEGRKYRAWMVFVGNGRYGEGLLRLNQREALDANCLDFRLARADSPLARARVVLSLVGGVLDRSPLLVQRQATAIELQLDRAEVDVALDGEVVRLRSPLRYASLPGALSVLAPAPGGTKMADR